MLIDVNATVRIEDGPPRKRAVATEELLSDVATAGHYQVGEPDALGNPIVLGQEMDYIDWKCTSRVWNVYKLTDSVEQDVDGNDITVSRFIKQGEFPTMEEANAFALTL